jgi:hypothetical protein
VLRTTSRTLHRADPPRRGPSPGGPARRHPRQLNQLQDRRLSANYMKRAGWAFHHAACGLCAYGPGCRVSPHHPRLRYPGPVSRNSRIYRFENAEIPSFTSVRPGGCAGTNNHWKPWHPPLIRPFKLVERVLDVYEGDNTSAWTCSRTGTTCAGDRERASPREAPAAIQLAAKASPPRAAKAGTIG